MTMKLRLLCLDFDGVILETVALKTRAYVELFRDEPAALPAILAYHRENLEQSRYVKFRHIHDQILKRPLSPKREQELADRFADLVRGGLRSAKFVPGARRFLESLRGRCPMVVVSGTPEAELVATVREHGLDRCFAGVYGTPPAKSERLPQVAALHRVPPTECLMVGDAPGDWRAARAARMPFVGRRGPGGPQSFPAEGTLAVVDDLRELGEWFAANITFV